jgi:hypothetical protein
MNNFFVVVLGFSWKKVSLEFPFFHFIYEHKNYFIASMAGVLTQKNALTMILNCTLISSFILPFFLTTKFIPLL